MSRGKAAESFRTLYEELKAAKESTSNAQCQSDNKDDSEGQCSAEEKSEKTEQTTDYKKSSADTKETTDNDKELNIGEGTISDATDVNKEKITAEKQLVLFINRSVLIGNILHAKKNSLEYVLSQQN